MHELTPYDKGKPDHFIDFYSLLDHFFADGLLPFRGLQNDSFKLDVRETENEYLIDAELAGFQKGDIRLDFEHGRLMISASKQDEKNQEKDDYIHRERYYSAMQRDLYLKNANGENIRAKFENGILEITVPKSQNCETKTQIEIL